MKSLSLNGIWSLRYSEPGEGELAGWPADGIDEPDVFEAVVPGDVHLDMVRAGVIADPHFGTNAEDCRWMETKHWWYSTQFTVPADFLPGRGGAVELYFHGLDAHADIWLNGTYVGATRNAFIGHGFDVAALAQAGENRLVVRVDSGLNWACTQSCEPYRWPGDATMAERIWLRRAQFTGGWDWGPRLLTTGIWRPVELRAYSTLALRDVRLITEQAGAGEAVIGVQYEIEHFGEADVDAEVEVRLGADSGGRKLLTTTLVPGYNLITDTVHLSAPRLWWPNGCGEPYLYDVTCRVAVGGEEMDSRSLRYGIRRIELIQEPLADGEGQSFAFAVNGRPIFCKGADWVPADSILAAVTPERYRALVEEAANAHFNMLRVWGGGVYEDDAWWDACDEYGILVWQDFMFACSAIPDDDPEFAALVAQEGRFVVRRLRNRASLALWCGNNENQWLAGRAAPHTVACGRRTYHETLAGICAQYDPSRPYWPSSPWGGRDPNSEALGDRHSWDIALNEDLDVRTGYKAYTGDRGKFISEYGFLAPPVEDSLREFLPDDQMSLDAPAWRFHDNTFEREVTRHALKRYFGVNADSLPLNQFLLLAQAYQAEAYRYTLAHFRRRRPLTAGALFWMYSDCWGATSGWTVIDHYLNRKPSFYAVSSIFAPLAATFIEEANGLSLWLMNDHRHAVAGRFEYGRGYFAADDYEVLESGLLTLGADRAQRVTHFVLPSLSAAERRSRYYWMRFSPSQGEPVQAVAFLTDDWGSLNLASSEVTYDMSALGANTYRLSLSADRFTWGLWLQHPNTLRPTANYLSLLPGIPYDVAITGPEEDIEGLSLTSLNEWLAKDGD